MGEKDITEKMLADYNDVFADIVNGLLFGGRQVVSGDSLENTKDRSQYKADDGKIHEEERDVVKYVRDQNIRIALVGLEHQTRTDADEPVRVIGYDGAAYRSQLLGKRKERYPVVTLVLYFGLQRWNRGRTLYEVLDIPGEWKPYVNDYRVNLFEVAFLEPEQVKLFRSDFRIVADYFVQKRTKRDYQPSQEEITHVDEVLKLLSVLTGDSRFEETQNSVKQEGGAVTMCEVLDRVEARGEARGKAIGEARGMIKGKAEGKVEGKVEAYHEMGLSASEIAGKTHLTEEKVKEIIGSMGFSSAE